MPLQFKDIFTSKGMWRREIQQQAAVDHAAIIGVKAGERRQARFGLFSADAPGEAKKVSPGDPDDPDTAATLRRGDGGNRFSGC